MTLLDILLYVNLGWVIGFVGTWLVLLILERLEDS